MSLRNLASPAWRRRLKRATSNLRMRRIAGGPVPERPVELRLFLVIRNEALRLPYMLRYNLEHGIDRVIALDNGSTDGTLDLLSGRNNFHVFQTLENYQMHGTWFDALLHRFGVGHWCLLADADELLGYPHMETLDFKGLTRYFDKRGYTAFSTLLVDFYPRGRTGDVSYRAGQDFREAMPFFDPPAYSRVPFTYDRCRTALDYRFEGGVRRRVFGQSVCCTNFPLVKFHRGMFLPMGRHAVEEAVIPEMRGALLHFKFFSDFRQRALLEAERGEHWNQAEEYKAYARQLREHGDFDFWRPESLPYRDSAEMVRLGIMQSEPAFDAQAEHHSRAHSER